MPTKPDDYSRMEKAILFLEENYHRQPELREVAQSVHLSEFHFQRLFRRWAGISPKRFIQFLTLRHAKQLLGGRTACSTRLTTRAFRVPGGCTTCSLILRP